MRAVRRTLAAALVVALTGCGGSSNAGLPSPAPAGTLTPSSSLGYNYRFVNGSPGAGNVDVYLYPEGALRPATATFPNVPFGGITPFAAPSQGLLTLDVLRAGAAATSQPIEHQSDVTQLTTVNTAAPLIRLSVVLLGTAASGTFNVAEFPEPLEQMGTSALVIHHASPAANILTRAGPIGIGVYSAATYPPGSASSGIPVSATRQLFTFAYEAGNAIGMPLPNTAGGGFIFIAPFAVAPFPAAVGFAVGLPSASATAHGPLANVIANAALSETAGVTSPYTNQISLTDDTAETLAPGEHLSEFLIDADQNGDVGLIGTLDP